MTFIEPRGVRGTNIEIAGRDIMYIFNVCRRQVSRRTEEATGGRKNPSGHYGKSGGVAEPSTKAHHELNTLIIPGSAGWTVGGGTADVEGEGGRRVVLDCSRCLRARFLQACMKWPVRLQ